MGYCRGVGRWPSNLAHPPDAACPTRNPAIAKETTDATLRFPANALFCDYRLMMHGMGYCCGVGRGPSNPAHPPGVTRSTWSSDIEQGTTELLCGRAPLSLRFGKESQNVTMASNDRSGLLANIDTGQQCEMLTDQVNVDIAKCIENGYRKYKW